MGKMDDLESSTYDQKELNRPGILCRLNCPCLSPFLRTRENGGLVAAAVEREL